MKISFKLISFLMILGLLTGFITDFLLRSTEAIRESYSILTTLLPVYILLFSIFLNFYSRVGRTEIKYWSILFFYVFVLIPETFAISKDLFNCRGERAFCPPEIPVIIYLTPYLLLILTIGAFVGLIVGIIMYSNLQKNIHQD